MGYHGCDRSVAEGILSGIPFKPSRNAYDWLGSGVYFWQANPERGLEWAKLLQTRNLGTEHEIKEPYVIGAVIDLGFCLDLITKTGITAVKSVFESLNKRWAMAGKAPLKNRGETDDLLLRELDCAVINQFHEVRVKKGLPKFDTVRGVFFEGKQIYPTSGFFEGTHVQICVRSPECIKGVFRVPDLELHVSR